MKTYETRLIKYYQDIFIGFNVVYEEKKCMFTILKSVEFDFIKDGQIFHKKIISYILETKEI